MSHDGPQADMVIYDECAATTMRTVIACRPDGTTYTLVFPADWDLGEALGPNEIVGYDAGSHT